MFAFHKNRKIAVALVTALLLTSTGVFAAGGRLSGGTQPLAVYTAADGLYAVRLDTGASPRRLYAGTNIRSPRLSPDGRRAAFTAGSDLFVCRTDGLGRAVRVAGAVNPDASRNTQYAWHSSADLVYATEDTGLYWYNTWLNHSIKVSGGDGYYSNLHAHGGYAYAEKWVKWSEGDSEYAYSAGIVQIQLSDGLETMLVEGRRSTLDNIGFSPAISSLSPDGRYLYIWRKPASGSLSSDGVSFGAYDLAERRYLPCGGDDETFASWDDPLVALAYPDNIAPDPTNSSRVAFNSGGDRMMIYNKAAGVLDIAGCSFHRLLPEGQVSMTPAFAPDGKSILYSATAELDDMHASENTNAAWMAQPHNIYRAELATGEITPVTQGDTYDFAPTELPCGEVLFLRREDEALSLWLTQDGVQTCLACGLGDPQDQNREFYWHIQTGRILDIYKG